MFCDFDKVFYPENKWENKKLTDYNPCMTCEVRKEYEKYLPQIAMSEGFGDDILKECNHCVKRITWIADCIQKLQWYEDNDERLKSEANIDVEYVIVGENEFFDNCLVCVIGESRKKAEGVLYRMLNNPSGNDKRIIGDLVNLRIATVDKKDCWWNENCD